MEAEAPDPVEDLALRAQQVSQAIAKRHPGGAVQSRWLGVVCMLKAYDRNELHYLDLYELSRELDYLESRCRSH